MEAPVEVVSQEFENLPLGVFLEVDHGGVREAAGDDGEIDGRGGGDQQRLRAVRTDHGQGRMFPRHHPVGVDERADARSRA